jgi:hypothetical protein
VALVDVVRAAIAETEDLDRVVFAVDERLAVFGNAVADLTHLVAELVENAVHFSPPEASVILRTRPYLQTPGAHVLTVEDWGVGMRPEDMAAANELLASPVDVDLSVSQRLGLHVVARLAQRHAIEVALTPTPGCGVTAAVVLPPSLFADPDATPEPAFADEPDELPAGVVPALAAATRATSVADLPTGPPPPVPAAPAARSGPAEPPGPEWPAPPAERWIDLTDDPAPAGADGNGHGGGFDAPTGNGHDDLVPADWSGWWEASPSDLQDGEPLSPIAARPPLAERVHPPTGEPDPRPPRSEPDPRAQGPRGHDPAPEAAADGPMLAQRVPQAHLAPELRRNREAAAGPADDGSPPDADEARAALSRYQASRMAARAVVDEGDAEPRRPAGGGWA